MATVTLKNFDSLQKKLSKLSDINVKQTVNKATTFVHGQAKELCPEDTGTLRASIHMEVKDKGKEVIGRVYTNAKYAAFVEFGTGIKGNGSYPYNIKGITLSYKSEPWLVSFKGNSGENIVVWTKGQKAQPYLYPALRRSKKYINSLINEGLEDKIKDICKGG